MKIKFGTILAIHKCKHFFIKRSKKQNEIKYDSWYELLTYQGTKKWAAVNMTNEHLHYKKTNLQGRVRGRSRTLEDCCYKFYFQYSNRSIWCNITIGEGERGEGRGRRGKLVDHTSYNLPEVKKSFLVDPLHFNWHHTSLNLQMISQIVHSPLQQQTSSK
jgi:hypothetical protein